MTANFRLCSLQLLTAFMMSSAQAEVNNGDMTTLTVRGILVETPECVVNNQEPIDVDFGEDVVISRINGIDYKKTRIIYSLLCTSLAKQGLKVTISGEPAAFNASLLATSKPALGIQLMHEDATLTPGNSVAFNYHDGTLPELWAVLVVQSNALPTAGTFTGNGTMVFEYQ
ncbi:fimbrial protein [Pantoea ananatis]|uniref:fimbrial protein n=1 Tax=Pantoea ananas TaxID=553 RepID=UPI00197EB427|nr:fimbrial protein [Pantoea ananatis]MBN6032026.1 fimbrial protein [Pantoea ananatis]